MTNKIQNCLYACEKRKLQWSRTSHNGNTNARITTTAMNQRDLPAVSVSISTIVMVSHQSLRPMVFSILAPVSTVSISTIVMVSQRLFPPFQSAPSWWSHQSLRRSMFHYITAEHCPWIGTPSVQPVNIYETWYVVVFIPFFKNYPVFKKRQNFFKASGFFQNC